MRNNVELSVFALALLAMGAGSALAAGPVTDPANGLRLAKRWCAECHVVSADQTTANADVPSFAAIAARPNQTPDALANLLAVPEKSHSKMQNLTLSRVEIGDIVAYIGTLKP